ncbi:MAG: stage IV sporulation protein A, partial [Agathobacter sp.]|nr:stage IV sporulation protein A [Agathobacter sp.]
FIKRFMDLCVLPNMEDGPQKKRTIDELPQSAQGKTIMTTEPKFIPQSGVNIFLDPQKQIKIRLVDCVGFLVDGANGHMEGEEKRMVKTPWFPQEIPFEEAARVGTLKVIREHATIGIVITTDGSFGEIPRQSYIEAEEETIEAMEKAQKPYIILLNSEKPLSPETLQLRENLEEKYHRPVMAVNCQQLQKQDIKSILETSLMEFPVVTMEFAIPKWMEMLDKDHKVKQGVIEEAIAWMSRVNRMRDLDMEETPQGTICTTMIRRIHNDSGRVELKMEAEEGLYYDFLSELTQTQITGEHHLIQIIRDLSQQKKAYQKVEHALAAVKATGFGVVTPELDDITMEEPILVTHAGKYGVKLRANSPSIHMIRANIETEIAPIVGNKEQAKDLITYIKDGENSATGMWSANIFGKTLGELMEDGIRHKIDRMDEKCQQQLQDTMQKIVNDNNGGMVLIIL